MVLVCCSSGELVLLSETSSHLPVPLTNLSAKEKNKKKRKNRKRRRKRNLWSRYAYRRTVCTRMQVHTIITRHVYSSTADLAVLFRERCDGGDEDTANVYHEPG